MLQFTAQVHRSRATVDAETHRYCPPLWSSRQKHRETHRFESTRLANKFSNGRHLKIQLVGYGLDGDKLLAIALRHACNRRSFHIDDGRASFLSQRLLLSQATHG